MAFSPKYNQPGTEYQYGHTDTGKGGGSIDTGKKPSNAPTEKARPSSSEKQRDEKHDREIYDQMKKDDEFMSEPTTTRGTESGAYNGLDTSNLRERAPEDI